VLDGTRLNDMFVLSARILQEKEKILMFRFHNTISSCYCIVCAAIALIGSPAYAQINSTDSFPEYQYVADYFNSMTNETPIEEVVTFLVDLRRSLLDKGYNVPKFSALAQNMYDQYFARSALDKEEFIQFCNFIEQREAKNTSSKRVSAAAFGGIGSTVIERGKDYIKSFTDAKIKRESKPHEVYTHKMTCTSVQVPDQLALGLSESLAGALLCIIPHPVATGIGWILIADGIRRTFNGTEEQSKLNMENRPVNPPNPVLK